MTLSKDFFKDLQAHKIKIGDIINFRRSEYENKGLKRISDDELLDQWNKFKDSLSNSVKFKLLNSIFEPKGNGVSLIVTRLESSQLN
jgi:hypothetical protein